MTRYAAGTDVSVERTEREIRATLTRYGADEIILGWSTEAAMIGFSVHGHRVRFRLPLPQASAFTHTNHRYPRPRTSAQVREAHEAAIRQRWRALLLTIKAKLESVESGIETFEEAFLAHLMLPGGETVGEYLGPEIDRIVQGGDVPSLVGGTSRRQVVALGDGRRV